MSAALPYWHGISAPDYYFITELGKKYWIDGRNTVSPWYAVCYKLSPNTFQVSALSHNKPCWTSCLLQALLHPSPQAAAVTTKIIA